MNIRPISFGVGVSELLCFCCESLVVFREEVSYLCLQGIVSVGVFQEGYQTLNYEFSV